MIIGEGLNQIRRISHQWAHLEIKIRPTSKQSSLSLIMVLLNSSYQNHYIPCFGLLSAWWNNILMKIFVLNCTQNWSRVHTGHPKQIARSKQCWQFRQPGRLPDHDWPNPREVAGHPGLIEGFCCCFFCLVRWTPKSRETIATGQYWTCRTM